MLKITEKSSPCPRRLHMASQRVSKKYRLAQQRKLTKKREYKKLKAIVPAISKKDKVAKITVIEEAIKYIDELHVALAKRMHLLRGLAPAGLPYKISPNMLAPVFPFPPNTVHPALMRSMPTSMVKPALSTTVLPHSQSERHR